MREARAERGTVGTLEPERIPQYGTLLLEDALDEPANIPQAPAILAELATREPIPLHRPTTPAQKPTPRYLSCAETAKLLRAALKRHFPETRFRVTSKTYSGGASIRVGWVDGPEREAVEAVCNSYEGAGFDGSIDLKYYIDSWLMPDGTVQGCRTTGTAGSLGYVQPIDDARPAPDAELVSFEADYIFCERVTAAEAAERKRWRDEWDARKATRKAAAV